MPISFRGVTLDQSTADKFVLAEKWIRQDINDPTFTLSFPQGSYSISVAASGGTHAGGGVADVHCIGYSDHVKEKMMYYFRACLGFGWHRPYNWDGAGGGEHMHIGELGNPNMSSALASQVLQWAQGENGLADHAADTDYIDVAAGRPPRITAPPGAPVTQEADMDQRVVHYPQGARWKGDFLWTGGQLRAIKTPAEESVLAKLGVPTVMLTTAEFDVLYAAFFVAG